MAKCILHLYLVLTVSSFVLKGVDSQCPVLSEPDNGDITYDPEGCPGIEDDCSAMYSCDEDYELNSTSAVRSCMNGMWSDTDLRCRREGKVLFFHMCTIG